MPQESSSNSGIAQKLDSLQANSCEAFTPQSKISYCSHRPSLPKNRFKDISKRTRPKGGFEKKD